MKTKKQIVLETVEEYSDPNNRALFYNYGGPEDATCVYKSKNGNRCAVGRCVDDENIEAIAKISRKVTSLYNGDDQFELCLKKEYKGHDIKFWLNIQKLHDTHTYWSEDGITCKGIEFVEKVFGIKIKELEHYNV